MMRWVSHDTVSSVFVSFSVCAAYPYLHMVHELWFIAYMLGYALGLTSVPSPLLSLLSLTLRRQSLPTGVSDTPTSPTVCGVL